ncbi:hypothetical protein Misp01_17000 [Microtetraspora sp. NBRC 13810]|uniref:hypothetical protein n=1 Tax=Microtetraspora sp. NBRC 13810 TaxID=3030990 RepID=UPI0024A0D3C9|nr:hypothetical protein [Microtetraspora sp. NBRC 13810]GLW06570.1 hypothetical protein Misp01_17000 [Microtetraspora sp. NBRC 13810]
MSDGVDALDALERRIGELRAQVRRAVKARETVLARALRGELRRAEQAWDDALCASEPQDPAAAAGLSPVPAGAPGDPASMDGPGAGAPWVPASTGEPGAPGSAGGRGAGQGQWPGQGQGQGQGQGGGRVTALVPVRERVHQALGLLGVPASPRLVVAVHEAFFAGGLRGPQFTSLRRDEERSFRASPYARPYYLCAALTERLSAARGLLAVSTWPLERRIVGPLGPRVDFLTGAERVAEHLIRLTGTGERPVAAASRLLTRMARNIPGATAGTGDTAPADPAAVIRAARAELLVHLPADSGCRASAATRASRRLGDAERLFGAATLSDAARKGA